MPSSLRYVLVGVALVLALPASARAGTAAVTGSQLTVTGDNGRDNWLSVEPVYGGGFYVDDESSPGNMTAGPGCATAAAFHDLFCGDASVQQIEIDLGDGDDYANIEPTDATAVIRGGEGKDGLSCAARSCALYGDDDYDSLSTGSGDDTLDTGPGGGVAYGGPGNDTLVGGDDTDQLYGGDGGDHIDGGPGGDSLYGGDGAGDRSDNDGADVLQGGDGYDTIDGGPGDDTIDGGPGEDRVDYRWFGEPVNVSLPAGTGGTAEEPDTLANVEDVTGTNGDDTIVGGPGRNQIAGGLGNDTLSGGADGDDLDGGEGDDTIYGGFLPGDPSPASNDTGDQLTGGPGDDTLVGGAGFDGYDAQEGNDTIDAREPDGGPPAGAESVFCGTGTDSAQLDTDDVPDRCESVVRNGRGHESVPPPWSVPAPPVIPGPPPPQQPATAALDIELDEPSVSATDGAILFKVRCRRSDDGVCPGVASAGVSKGPQLSHRSFRAKSGKKTVIRTVLSRSARKLIRRKRRVTAVASIVVTVSGQPPVRWSRRITIKKAAL